MFTRRSFISKLGLASGGGLLTAFASQLWVRAEAPALVPRRLVTIVQHNGWWPKLLRPQNMNLPSDQWVLPEALAPLDHLRDKMTLFEGLHNPHGRGFHGTYGGSILGVVPNAGPKEGFGGITIDRYVASELGGQTPFSSINLSYPMATSSVPNASADGPGAPYPAMSQPAQIIADLFAGSAEVDQEELLRGFEQRMSVLDASISDINRMRSRLAGAEKAQMDQYLNSIRELELQLESLQDIDCSTPEYAGGYPQPGQLEIVKELCEFYYTVGALALECGLTNVLTIAWPGVGQEPMQPKFNFSPCDAGGLSLHAHLGHDMQITHSLDNDSEAGWAGAEDVVAVVRRIYAWRASSIATFIDQLGATDLGGYTTADRTLVMWLNAGGGRHHDGTENIPLMFLGNPDGVLNAGRYERFPSGERCVSDAFVTAAQAMGIDTDTFGDPEHSRGALPGSLA